MATLIANWTGVAPFYEYKLTGPDPSTTIVTTGVTPSTTVTIDGLINDATYTFYLRGICENNLYTPWSTMSGITCNSGYYNCTLSGGTAIYVSPLVLYGKSYNWYAANHVLSGASIAPTGWHLSTPTEWNNLFSNYGSNSANLKAAGTLSSNPAGLWGDPPPAHPEYAGNNSSGFNIQPGGIVQWGGTYGVENTYTDFWCAGDISTTYPVGVYSGYSGSYYAGRYKNFGASGITMYEDTQYHPKNYGFSVRLVKDSIVGSTIGDMGIMTDIDGNIYETRHMADNKIWMIENLRVSRYNDGTLIPYYELDTPESRTAWHDTEFGGIGNYH